MISMTDDATFSHLSNDGEARMVDVGGKEATRREAIAEAWVDVGAEIATSLAATGSVAKGNVFETARIAAIIAAKKTGELIPMCHPLPLDVVDVAAELCGERVRIVAMATCYAKTGVEMEAMTAAAVAALTIYDMVKSAGKGVTIGPVRLLSKKGGKSGDWQRDGEDA